MFRFAFPWGLLALLLAVLPPLLALRRRRKGTIPRLFFSDLRPLAHAARTPASRIAPLRPWLRAAAVASLAIAFARPQAGHREEEVVSEGIDIVIALDISGSMRAMDFKPKDRLSVARDVVAKFVEGRKSDRIGLITFSRIAATRCPLTLDYQVLSKVVGAVEFSPAEDDGTAIGMGLATSLARLKDAKGKSKVVILLTDGINNAGTVDPQTAADIATSLGVRVHTVGVGSDGPVPLPLPDGRIVRAELPIDEAVLREIARRTGGEYFRATDTDGLRRVFQQIDDMEKTKVEVKTYARYADLFAPFLVLAGALLLIEGASALTRLRVLP